MVSTDIMSFSTFDRETVNAPDLCSLCRAKAASLRYAVSSSDDASQKLNGYCCSDCASNLVTALEQRQRSQIGVVQGVFYA